MWDKLVHDFTRNFIEDDRWKYLTNGLKNTLLITVVAALIGIVLGFLVATVRSSYDKSKLSEHKPGFFLSFLNAICQFYVTVIRGTPVVVQLLITYFIIFATSNNKMLSAFLAFGLNSGAYVAEIVRAGIESIDQGQMEAGRSLGLSFGTTMGRIIMPQAFRNVLPALANEFISLLKETSVAGYIAIADLSKGGDIIRSNTYDPYMPLFAVALIYLTIVLILSTGVKYLERRLHQNGK